ncbi:hypothetical protein V2J09_005464 [Rumex salicifolius]
MIHTKSESDVTSLAPSAPSAPSSPSRSPKRQIYYVQSPSRDSHDGDKSSSLQATTPMFNSPMESPSHPSFGRHSRNSSASRFSGIFRSSSGRKSSRGKRVVNDKGWPECNVIMEEGGYDELDDKGLSRRVQVLIGVCGFVLLFTVFCLIIWGAARPFRAQSLTVSTFIVQEGTDFSGVPTKMLTVNASLRITIHNPATFFGIHVTSTPINLLYSKISVATGQLAKHYQPRKSLRTVAVILEGTKVPLYGAGSSLTASSANTKNSADQEVPFTLEFDIRAKGEVVGKLVTTRHRTHVSCAVVVDYTTTKPIKFKKGSCVFN